MSDEILKSADMSTAFCWRVRFFMSILTKKKTRRNCIDEVFNGARPAVSAVFYSHT